MVVRILKTCAYSILILFVMAVTGLAMNEYTLQPKFISRPYKVSEVEIATEHELRVGGDWYRLTVPKRQLRFVKGDSERLFVVIEKEGIIGIERHQIDEVFVNEIRLKACNTVVRLK